MSMVMASTTAVTAGMVFQIFCRWHASKFQSLGDVFLDGMLDFMKLLAGIKKIAGHGIIHQRVAMLLEIGDLRIFKLASLRLLFVKSLALVHDGFVLAASVAVSHKRVDMLTDGIHSGLVNDGLAQRLRLLQNRVLFNLSRHWLESLP